MAIPAATPVLLEKNDIPLAAAMLARAFESDPKMTHLLPDIAARTDRSRFLFEFEIRYGLIYGEVYATSPACEGVCVWLPSEKSAITLWRAFRAGGFRLRDQLGPEGFNRLMSFSDRVDALHAQHLSVPHIYLFFIGVDPVNQGQGLAGKLIRPMLERLDARGFPCYLNTQNEKNVGLYEHFGFRVVDRQMIPGSSIIHTAMVRDPRSET
ncbi:N-acetyltransferase [Methanoregula sp. PtaB.Bin085]|uniref:GNAT family N-acetyltransferase n=1 Tax=Methanoregula sp. PtaB.Bin085 TaxID=1811680 RepID=UPI0009C8052A|nr:GNAT family N-acetyltransferase [Methanoregula sp. PtaB.Bin085]OPX65005.1 MAG: Mycothiol acetyltransferase [Methanoregula sp. PtaB.Bin085]